MPSVSKLNQKSRSYLELLAVILLLILLLPLSQTHGDRLAQFIFSGFFLIVLLSCLQTARTRGIRPQSKVLRLLILISGGGAAVLDVIDLFFAPYLKGYRILDLGSTICYAILLSVVCSLIVLDLFSGKKITLDKIFGAAAGYLLFGVFWVCIFAILEILRPGSVSFADGTAVSSFAAFIYFSFTTLTTLGYGDIVPHTPLAMSLSSLEAIAGQFFMAVIVARLVGLYTSQAMLERRGT